MKIRHIVLEAALMTLQATALYLLMAAPHAHAARVYRCGNSYQAQPCAHASGQQLDIRDDRTPEQVRQAQQAARKLADVSTSAPKRGKASKKKERDASRNNAGPIALSCRPFGARPFETCNDKPKPKKQARQSTATAKAKSPKTQRPFVARAASDRQEAAAETTGR